GGTTASVTGTAALSGVISEDASNVTLGGTPAYSFATASAGNGKTITTTGYTLGGSAAGNYSLGQPSLAANITPKALTVTVDPKSKTAGESDPSWTYQVTAGSLVSGDSFSGDLTRDSGESAGTYAIKQGTLSAGSNYAITYVGANLTINSAGPTFESAYPGVNLADVAPNGLTYLVNYAFGGSSTSTAKLPEQDTTDPTKLKLVAYVRTNNTAGTITVKGQVGSSLSSWDANLIDGVPASDNTGAPEGTQKQIFSVDVSGDRQFLRLKVTK
ncbi:MAG: hypothetical protein EBZ05_06095, partial [Verrucomicrobia bacterium]|nr:hypothetical protein [Verrucomicrobiota bacterium]